MDKADTTQLLKSHEPDIRAQGVTAVFLFGSTARGEARPGSDVDIFVDHDDRFSLTDLSGLKIFLEGLLKTEVDVTTRDGLHPMLKDNILREAEQVL